MNKPLVRYVRQSLEMWDFGDLLRSRVFTINHPRLGSRYVLTSIVLRIETGGLIEILNTIYEPIDQSIEEANPAVTTSIDSTCAH